MAGHHEHGAGETETGVSFGVFYFRSFHPIGAPLKTFSYSSPTHALASPWRTTTCKAMWLASPAAPAASWPSARPPGPPSTRGCPTGRTATSSASVRKYGHIHQKKPPFLGEKTCHKLFFSFRAVGDRLWRVRHVHQVHRRRTGRGHLRRVLVIHGRSTLCRTPVSSELQLTERGALALFFKPFFVIHV